MRTAVGIVDWYERATSAVATESALAEELAGLLRRVERGGAKAIVAGHTRRHAWRAEQWAAVVPQLHDRRPGKAGRLVDALDPAEIPSDRLGGWYSARLPALLSSYEAWAGDVRGFADGPIGRVLAIVVEDVAAERSEAAVLLAEHPGVEKRPSPTPFRGA